MANYATLKAAIAAAIKQNGNNEITGNLLQQQLLAMVNSLGFGCQYVGIATPDTNPGTPDQNVFYIASTAGTYANFGGLVLADGEIAILKYNGAWSKDSTGAASVKMVNQLGQNVADLDTQINGVNIHETLVSLTTRNANIIYFDNPLLAGESAQLKFDIATSTWTRFLFATNNTESFSQLIEDPTHYTGLEQTKTLGETILQVTAPDPTIYPYLGLVNPGVGNSIFLTKDIVQRGIVDDINDLQTGVANNSEAIDGVRGASILNVTGIVSNITYVANPLKNGDRFSLEFNIQTENWVRFAFSKNNTGTDWNAELGDGNLYFYQLNNIPTDPNRWHGVAPDPEVYPYLMYQKPAAANAIILQRLSDIGMTEDVYMLKQQSALSGKRVLMLGDSISQLPYTGGATYGRGIVEYFTLFSGATAIRGAFGGSHIRARRVLSSASDINDIDTAKAAFDIVYIVKALCEQDWTLQDAAIAWMTSDGSLDTYWPTILADLKAVDMAKIDAVTIFAGTNDYANNVYFNDTDSTPPAECVEIQRENGAWNYILSTLANTYKTLSVFVFTPIVKIIGGVWCEDTQNTRGYTLSDYAENNLAAAKRYQYPGCDLFYTMGWNKYNFATYAPDGTHPTNGFDCLGRKMAEFVAAHYNRS